MSEGKASLPRQSAGLFVATLFGLGWFVYWAGWGPLNPANVSWLLAGDDWSAHLLGWLFFRKSEWAFPLGRIDGLLYPTGTYVGFTDSIPWVALVLRPISGLLPSGFQYIGPWLALSAALMGLAGASLARSAGASPLQQALAGALLATSPMIITRVGHDALCAQWILVALIGLNIRQVAGRRDAKRVAAASIVLVVISAGVHPYLSAMCVALALASIWRLAWDGWLSRAEGAAAAVAVCGAALVTFAIFGYFTLPGGGDQRFGWLSADLLSLINPRGQSRVLPDLPAPRPNLEGWGFLGTGVLLLIALAAASAILRRRTLLSLPWRRIVPLFVVTGLSWAYALGNEITLGHRVLLDLSALYRHLDVITRPFRANGRFIWIAHYAVACLAVVLILRLWRERPHLATAALATALAIQCVDFNWRGSFLFSRPFVTPAASQAWSGMGGDYAHLAFVPPQVMYSQGPCEGDVRPGAWVPFAYLAYREGMTFNSGYSARYDLARMYLACAGVTKRALLGDLSPDTVYVYGPSGFRSVVAKYSDITCGVLDGFGVCVSNLRDTRLRRTLAGHR